MAPSQIATRVISICATVWAVEIHAPSSKPACTAPRMSASPSVDRRVLRVEMNVPSSTAKRPSQGMEVGGGGDVGGGAAGGGGAAPPTPTALIGASAAPAPLLTGTAACDCPFGAAPPAPART